MYDDGEFDYRTLSLAELEYAAEHIDGIQFPKNLANARAALEARASGISPEPAPLLDAESDAKYTYWVQKILGALAAAYGLMGLMFDKIVMIGSFGRIIILEGTEARVGSGCLIFLGAFAILAPKSRSTVETLFPRIWWVYPIALVGPARPRAAQLGR